MTTLQQQVPSVESESNGALTGTASLGPRRRQVCVSQNDAAVNRLQFLQRIVAFRNHHAPINCFSIRVKCLKRALTLIFFKPGKIQGFHTVIICIVIDIPFLETSVQGAYQLLRMHVRLLYFKPNQCCQVLWATSKRTLHDLLGHCLYLLIPWSPNVHTSTMHVKSFTSLLMLLKATRALH